MKFPRKITVAGKPIQVFYDKSTADSEYDGMKRTITIGTKGDKSADKLDSFLHETFEAITHLRGVCYERPLIEGDIGNDDCIYVITHDELNVVISDLAVVVGNLLK